jgi:hypothetical protein
MKTTVALLTFVAGTSAFAPAKSNSNLNALKAASDYKGVIGSDSLETGKQMVSDC